MVKFPVYMERSGTLTVKHFLYKQLKRVSDSDKKTRHPIYVRIGFGKTQFDFKSDFQYYLKNSADSQYAPMKDIGFKTEEEFDTLMKEKQKGIGKALEIEKEVIWQVSDLLRNNYYPLGQKGTREVINKLMTNLDVVLNEGCISLLKDILYTSPEFNEVAREFQVGLNWGSQFDIVYKLLSFISKESGPVGVIMRKFKEANDLFPLISEFENFKNSKIPLSEALNSSNAKSRLFPPFGKIMSYQWPYYDLENEFQSFLKNKGFTQDQIDNAISIINYSLNRYFEQLKITVISTVIFPSPSLKPLPLRS